MGLGRGERIDLGGERSDSGAFYSLSSEFKPSLRGAQAARDSITHKSMMGAQHFGIICIIHSVMKVSLIYVCNEKKTNDPLC